MPSILFPIDALTFPARDGARTLGEILNRRTYAAAAIVALLVCTGCGSRDESSPAAVTTAEPAAIASATATGQTPQAANTAAANSLPEQVFEQEVTVEAMDEMPIEEFAQLPYADRLAYSLSKIPQLADYLETDKEFVAQDPEYITAGLWHSTRMESLAAADPVQGSKIYSAMQLYVTRLNTGEISPEFLATVESLQNLGGGVSLSEDLVYESHGDWQVGADRLGNPIEFTNLTYVSINRQGELVPDSQKTSQAVKVHVKTLDGVVHTAFPQGYTAKGRVSPDGKYDY